jgi:hypothetical protein
MYLFKHRKKIAFLLLGITLQQTFYAPAALALTSGPSQPEVQSFEPAGTTEMVDLFTGDFTYNIPLFELPGPNGGYPFNLAYHAGIGVEQESSWVGLGWNLNPGAVNRQMRGLPDDFNGDIVLTKNSIKPNVTIGVGAGATAEFFGGDLNVSLGFSVYNNNYKGVGHSIDGSVGYSKAAKTGITAGLGFSDDSQQGFTLSPSIGLGELKDKENANTNQSLGIGYNSRQGLKSITYSAGQGKGSIKNQGKGSINNVASGSYSLSLYNAGFTPQVSLPMTNENVAVNIKAVGGAAFGAFASPYYKGFYNSQHLVTDGITIPTPAFGYMNYQNASPESALQDFSREKDGIVRKESPNLAIPSLTYDIYSLTGQGIASMYRPMRNDYGYIHDPKVESGSVGISAGADIAPTLTHAGANFDVNYSRSVSQAWKDNPASKKLGFRKKEVNDISEPWYFKVHGEPTVQSNQPNKELGDDEAVRIQLKQDNVSLNDKLEKSATEPLKDPIPDRKVATLARQPRGEVILPLTNAQLKKEQTAQTAELVNLFKIKYADKNTALTSTTLLVDYSKNANDPNLLKTFPRVWSKNNETYKTDDHVAGITALNTNGLRYNYALPAYNLMQEEVQFSPEKVSDSPLVNNETNDNGDPKHKGAGTDHFLSRTKMPPFTHSYMLTSIVGPDYVDVTGDGVTADDLGYWVKFTYRKVTSDENPYKWRAPFAGSLFNPGLKTDRMDDRASYVYGEKEIWYLAQAETKSHVATFITDGQRTDGLGAMSEMQNTNQVDVTNGRLHKLVEIRLFTRSAGPANPLKIVKFKYADQANELCKGIPNGDPNAVAPGKLTLEQVWFEYGASARGKISPYTFLYQGENPTYNMDAIDRWGIYKPNPFSEDKMYPKEAPYAEQDPAKKALIDAHAAAWSLTEIRLPSGGKIKVDYESDDYAYVQHREAMQMVQLVDPNGNNDVTGELDDNHELQDNFLISDQLLKIRFQLEQPIPMVDGKEMTAEAEKREVEKYLDLERKQIAFKVKIRLRSDIKGKPQFETISGYADIDEKSRMGLELGPLKNNKRAYEYGYFHLKPEEGRHPFSLRAWQHLKLNQPDLIDASKLDLDNPSVATVVEELMGLLTRLDHIRQLIQGFNNFCSDEGWGREIVANRSWIRLKSPDLIKYGGGLRVKQITLIDNWQGDTEGVYGQRYEYTTKEENGRVISSGVATYEPAQGGEENPLRTAKKFEQSIPLASTNTLYFELPVNEGYFPGPSVGYRKVTVKSLASAALAKESLSPGSDIFPKDPNASFGTSGVTVHEFYTAKDFPVIVKETVKDNDPYPVFVPVPFIGTITQTDLTTSQGYSIITNDMHGKPARITYYRQDPKGNLDPKPVSYVEYHYASKTIGYDGREVKVLRNLMKNPDQRVNGTTVALIGEREQVGDVETFTLGQETEFFADMREHIEESWVGGAQFNVDVLYFLFVIVPITIPWPNVTYDGSTLRTAVTNKVIFKTGILESVEAYDGGSKVVTKNLQWDKVTGRPVLTSVTNNFDAPIYSYSKPAYQEYEGMGPAYKNIGLEYTVAEIDPSADTHQYHFKLDSKKGTEVAKHLHEGDEVILYNKDKQPVAKGVYLGTPRGLHTLYTKDNLTEKGYTALIVRSGFRNQLTVDAGTITALVNPMDLKPTRERSITIPSPGK